jgi:uncharacterized protein
LQEKIGSLKYLRRYPVKSMMGEDLTEARINFSGISGDRTYAFIDDRNFDKRFPWMTARQANEMLLYKPRMRSVDDIEVESPEGKLFSITDDTFELYLEEKFGYELSLRHDRNGCFDSKPVSLIGLDTVKKLSVESNLDLRHERFRANLYVEWDNKKPFFEDELVGKALLVGDEENGALLRVVKKDSRCIIPTLDPVTSVPFPGVLEVIKNNHQGCAGVYAVVERPGTVRVGDSIRMP